MKNPAPTAKRASVPRIFVATAISALTAATVPSGMKTMNPTQKETSNETATTRTNRRVLNYRAGRLIAGILLRADDLDDSTTLSRRTVTMSNLLSIEKPQLEPQTGLRSITAIIADLSKPVAAQRLKTRQQGGKTLTYLPWYQAVHYLDRYAPGWSYKVCSVVTVGQAVAVTVRINILCLEGIVYREATGYEPLDVKGYGDPTSNAKSMALRRSAAKFSLALYLYDK
jgi:hypothetical protein